MGPRVRFVACILSAALVTACTGRSPSAPSAPPAPAPAVGAAAIFLTPNSWDMPAGGGALEVTIVTAANPAGNVMAPGIVVELDASSGSLSDVAPRTDAFGHAKVTWTGTSSATITARAGDAVGTSAIRVPAAAPAPNPNPGPNPGPSPQPTPQPEPPSPSRLIVEIIPFPVGGDAITPITFTARVTTPDGSPTGSLTYAWDFESDGQIDSTEATPTHLFAPADHWTVTLRVTAADGRAGVRSIDVVIGAAPRPVVTATLSAAPSAAVINEPFTFTATGSGNTTAGAVVAFDWDFDASTPSIDLTTASGSASTSYATAGTRTVRVTARTANGTSGTATRTVTVNNPPLVVSLIASSPRTAGATVTFSATVTSTGPVPSGLSFAWDFDGNGTTDAVTTGSPSSSAGFTFNAPGDYKAKVTVTSPDGRTTTNTITVTVS